MTNYSNKTHNFYIDIVATSTWGSVVLYGLLANFLIIIGISRNRLMRSSTSYWLIVHLSICDIIMLSVTGVYILPATLLHDDSVELNHIRNVLPIFIYNTFWYTSVLSLALMALNRLTSIACPSSYVNWFSPRKTIGYIFVLYSIGVVISLPTLFDCCRMVYDHFSYKTVYQSEETSHYIVDLAINSFSLTIMVICYGWLVCAVRNSRRRLEIHHRQSLSQHSEQSDILVQYRVTQRMSSSADRRSSQNAKRRDICLGLQFSIVSFIFLITFVSWQICESLDKSPWLYVCMTGLFMINNSTNPTVYIIFNSNLRNEIVHLGKSLRRNSSSDSRRRSSIQLPEKKLPKC